MCGITLRGLNPTDVVILEGDPLPDITNPRRVRTVLKCLVDRAGGGNDQDDMNPSWSAVNSLGNAPVFACSWDQVILR